MGFYDNTLLITAVRGSRLLKFASNIIAVSPKLHVLALFFVCFIWHVYWHRNDGNFLVCHEGVIVGFDWGPPLSPCNGQLNTRIIHWSSVCQSQRTWLSCHWQDALIVRGPVGHKQAPVFIVAWVTSNGWFLRTQNYRFSIHLALSACFTQQPNSWNATFLYTEGVAPRHTPLSACVWLQVLAAGRIQEYDRPYVLLQDKDGFFHQMVEQTGRAEAASLLHTAKQVTTPTSVPMPSPNGAQERRANPRFSRKLQTSLLTSKMIQLSKRWAQPWQCKYTWLPF